MTTGRVGIPTLAMSMAAFRQLAPLAHGRVEVRAWVLE